MHKLKMHSLDGVKQNIEMIGKLFPNTITEVIRNGKVEHAIDFDVLRQELSDVIVEGREERYQFTWPDKKKAILAANAPITATLRPIQADSVGKDGTPGSFNSENLYIEGDNLEVLKLLQETYLGKIKMIYIDPPYNTGNDFVYDDDFAQRADKYMENSGQYDEEGNRMVTNTESNGRFHTDWLNMVYPRLKIAKDLLAEDGVIFISIDDNEQENLKKCCDEVFGAPNFVTQLVWEKKKKGAFLSKKYINMKEYILVYAKDNRRFNGLIGEITSEEGTYPCIKTTNARGVRIIRKGTPSKYKEQNYRIEAGTRISSGNMELIYVDDLIIQNGILQNDIRIDSNWIYGQEALDRYAKDGLLYITQDNYVRRIVSDVRTKMLKDLLMRVGSDGQSLASFVYDENLNNGGWGTNEDANDELHKILDKQYLFQFLKPVRLIGKLMQSVIDKDAIILDFFSGSATTAHAVMQLNAEDGGHRKFIMVQLPELCDEKSEAYKAGYKNICEIGKERIRRAGKKISDQLNETTQRNRQNVDIANQHSENSQLRTDNVQLDIGFRCLRLDESNMQHVYYMPDAVEQQDLFSQVDNVKPDRSPEDLLFQVMLDLGVLLSSTIEVKEIAGKKVFNVADGFLLACFDHDITDETVKTIAQMKPHYAVFRDSSMANDSVAANFEQMFKAYSPDTVRKVL